MQIPTNIYREILRLFQLQAAESNPAIYLYSFDQIRSNIERLNANKPLQVEIYYAMKANPHPKIMDLFSREAGICGVEIASGGELEYAQGFWGPEQILYTGPGKKPNELKAAAQAGIAFINVESVAEAVRLERIACELGKSSIDVLLRVNLNYDLEEAYEHMGGRSTKMGIDEDELSQAIVQIQQLPHIRICGLHVFAASGVLSAEQLITCQDYIFRLVKRCELLTGTLPVIDLGGGFGIDYTSADRQLNLNKYYSMLRELVRKYGFESKRLILELGTFLVGNAGYYVSKIIDIKAVKGKKHIILAGGVNHMGLPLEMRRKHPVAVIPMHEPPLYSGQPVVAQEIADISGPLCMVSDCLCWDEMIPHAEIGDLVVFFQAGAYCFGEGMHRFLMHPSPSEFVV